MNKKVGKNWEEMNMFHRLMVLMFPNSEVSSEKKGNFCNVSVIFNKINKTDDFNFTMKADIILLANRLGWLLVHEQEDQIFLTK
jgi:hypothetical protein